MNNQGRNVVLDSQVLKSLNLGEDDIILLEVEQQGNSEFTQEEESISTQVYLDRFQTAEIDISIDEIIKITDSNSRSNFRKLILGTLVPSMLIIPIVLMVLLIFPGIGLPPGELRSENIQISLLAAIASDILSLYVIITRNLFPEINNKG